jgi:hypothetical protein
MESIRFAGLIVGAFLMTFAVAFWLVVPRPLKPDPSLPTWHRVDVDSPQYKYESSNASDSDAVRDKLRNAVLEAADDLQSEPCNDAMKAHYIDAATKYARAWLSISPCVGTGTCGSSDNALLDRAQKAFGSPLDHRVREAMVKAHETGALKQGDFPNDAVVLVAQMARDPVISPRADPAFKKAAEEMRAGRGCRAYGQ